MKFVNLSNNYLYIMHFAGLAGVFALSNQHNHWYHPSGPQEDLEEAANLPSVAHLVLQDKKVDNRKGHSLLVSSISSSAFLTFHYHAR